MDSVALVPSLYTVKAVFILDNDGNRLVSKYYDTELYSSMKEQKNFEKNVFNKTYKADMLNLFSRRRVELGPVLAVQMDDGPLSEQTVAQVLQTAKEQIKWSILK
ncbi:hypothetical protein SKAU_G00294480 [Synaphobranchus kaupii]|uniref:Coatomer subunit zeta n=1 Tax=Synaphobranchus kaupii TaxID=118154 RepID=A0A9Q1EUI9_SYNKA|nr:hypothetical protein SKAU_G00294480 [Synaphobranchus kaupii]